jgi:hypothetical protein
MAVAPTSELVGRPPPAAPAAMAPARRRPALSWQSAAAGVVFAFPLVFLAAFALYPLLQQAIGSLFRWYDLRSSAFAGLSDYSQVLRDPVVPSAALHSLVYVGRGQQGAAGPDWGEKLSLSLCFSTQA